MHQFKRLLAAIALLCASASHAWAEAPSLPLPFVKITELYVTTSASRLYGPDNAVYVMTHGQPGTAYGPQQTGVWHTVDLAPFGVAADAQAAYLTGLLIITGGTTGEIADLHVGFRRPGDTTPCSKYLGQTSSVTHVIYLNEAWASLAGGQRTNMSTWVPLADGKFEFCYTLSTGGSWPTNPAYGINLSLQAWGR